MLWFVIGLFAGAFLGILGMALFAMAAETTGAQGTHAAVVKEGWIASVRNLWNGSAAGMDNRETNPRSSRNAGGFKNGGDFLKIIAAKSARAGVTAAERYGLISKAAYLRAQNHGFSPVCELQVWLEAAAEVDEMLGKTGKENPPRTV